MDWKTVAEKIIQDDQNKWDRGVSGRELRVEVERCLAMYGEDGVHLSLSEMATSQLPKLEIPVRYYRRLPDEMKSDRRQLSIWPAEREFISFARQRRVDTRVPVSRVRGIQ